VAASESVRIRADGVELEGTLDTPRDARGVVLFAHGSGSSRLSPRNVFVARELHKAGLATVLFDLLTADEDQDYAQRFDIGLLSRRLDGAAEWLARASPIPALPLGLFGASTGAAAALRVAALRRGHVRAVVSRGGRPDLVPDDELARVDAATLLIVGGFDHEVIRLNEMVYRKLKCEKNIEIVAGATHLFEEPGTLEQVAAVASRWFSEHLQ
jgi:putative phosphoribosyl transferase